MTDQPDQPGPDGPLGEIAEVLGRDGFTAAWDVDAAGGVTFRIGAGSAACADCLVPAAVLEAMLADALEGTSWRVVRVEMPQ